MKAIFEELNLLTLNRAWPKQNVIFKTPNVKRESCRSHKVFLSVVCLRHFLISGINRNCRTHEAPRDLKFGMYAN